MAQQARPHWYTQREYDRPRLNSCVSGFGNRPLSTRPISTSPSVDHTRSAGHLAPGIDEAERSRTNTKMPISTSPNDP